MSITVGPIETYVTDSELSNPTNYAEVGTQEQVSVNLTSSTLWLVDSSTLNTQTVSTSPIVEQPLEPSVQDSVPFANINTTAPGISLPAAINDGTSVTSIQDTNPLLLAEVSGTSQFNSASTTTGLTSSSTGTDLFTSGTPTSTFQTPNITSSTSLPGVPGTGTPGTSPNPDGSTTSIMTPPPSPSTPVPFGVSTTPGILLLLVLLGAVRLRKRAQLLNS
jgi:hypothetical protein